MLSCWVCWWIFTNRLLNLFSKRDLCYQPNLRRRGNWIYYMHDLINVIDTPLKYCPLSELTTEWLKRIWVPDYCNSRYNFFDCFSREFYLLVENWYCGLILNPWQEWISSKNNERQVKEHDLVCLYYLFWPKMSLQIRYSYSIHPKI